MISRQIPVGAPHPYRHPISLLILYRDAVFRLDIAGGTAQACVGVTQRGHPRVRVRADEYMVVESGS
jgi:hypothetical protein